MSTPDEVLDLIARTLDEEVPSGDWREDAMRCAPEPVPAAPDEVTGFLPDWWIMDDALDPEHILDPSIVAHPGVVTIPPESLAFSPPDPRACAAEATARLRAEWLAAIPTVRVTLRAAGRVAAEAARTLAPLVEEAARNPLGLHEALGRARPEPEDDDPRRRALAVKRNRGTGPPRDPFRHRGMR